MSNFSFQFDHDKNESGDPLRNGYFAFNEAMLERSKRLEQIAAATDDATERSKLLAEATELSRHGIQGLRRCSKLTDSSTVRGKKNVVIRDCSIPPRETDCRERFEKATR